MCDNPIEVIFADCAYEGVPFDRLT